MSAVPRYWMTHRLTRATWACLARLLVGPGKRLYTLASRHDDPTAARPRYAPRPAPIATRLVASDGQRGMCGRLPSGSVAPGAFHAERAPGISVRESKGPLAIQRLMGG
jgi:hypothetical protein